MLVKFVVSPGIAERLLSMNPSELTMVVARIAASKEVGILDINALKEAEEAIANGKTQDVVVLEGLEVMGWGYPGPWNALRIIIHGSSQNPQLHMESDALVKQAVGLLAEMFREQVLADVQPESVAGYGYRDFGGFAQASPEKLTRRRAELAN